MFQNSIILGLVAAGSPIEGVGENLPFGTNVWEGLILLAVAALAAYLVSLAVRAETSKSAVPVWLGGLVVAAAGGYLALFTEGVAFGAALYLLVGSAAMLYHFPRPGELALWCGGAIVGGALLYLVSNAMAASFALVATVAVTGAFKTLNSRELVHSAIWLASVLVSVAGAFLILGSPFLAIIQILVYVGAVITLILFTTMLTVPTEESHFLDELELPPGITVESVKDLDPVTPSVGQGPMKSFGHPRKPTRRPDTMYGVSIADGVFGTEYTEKRIKKEGN